MLKLRVWAYRWLPRICGCHRKPERSFFFHGRQAPVCARCTGELVGIPVGLVSCFFLLPPWWVAALLMVPMVVDGFLQLLTKYESTNPRRFLTGLLFGYALFTLFALFSVFAYHYGYELGKQMVQAS